jgi:hypothetical protein
MDPLSLSLHRLRAVPRERWDALAGRRIFFGHQSVGANVLAGVRAVLADAPGIRLEIAEASDPGALDRPVLAHAFLGRNGDPIGKIDHFRSLLESGIGEKADTALFKLCYVDIDASTDISGILAHYDRTMAELRAKYPRLALLAVTVPLTNMPPGLKSRIKRLIGRGVPALKASNARRNEFNEHLRKVYAGRLWDLAAAESLPGGGRSIELLNPAFTSDGGHLNDLGGRVAAIDLLVRLSEMESR